MAILRLPRLLALLPCACLLLAGACDKAGGNAKADTDAKSDAKAEPSQQAKATDDDNEDEGHAKLLLGGKDWSTDRARAKLDDGKLRIFASKSERVDGQTRREALTLLLRDFAGPGSYTTDKVNSNFTGVGFDAVEALDEAAAKNDDTETAKATKDLVQKSTVVLLQDAKVEITKVDDDYIDGTLEWSGVGGINGPRSISGSFHARIKKD